MPTRVLICGDDRLLGAGLQALLDGQPDFEVVEQATCGRESIRLVRELSPDVVLVCSVGFPPAVRRELGENARLIMFADADSVQDVAEVLSVNARAVLPPGGSPGELMNAIRLVASGDMVLMPLGFKRRFEQVLRDAPPRRSAEVMHTLTLREGEVLRLLAHGFSNAEIAGRLCISETTVRSHVHHMLGKLSVRSRAQAVAVAYENGLIPPYQKAEPSLRVRVSA